MPIVEVSGKKPVAVIYRDPAEEMAPSAINIDGEPVWAEMARDSDMSFTYVTRDIHSISHIWIAWAADDPEAIQFQMIQPITDDGESPIAFKSYASALRAAAELSGCRP
jgi:hypothetical protein